MQNLKIYEINIATWLNYLNQNYKEHIDLSNVPKKEWDIIADYGFNAVWLMGVWQRSPAAIEVNSQDIAFEPEMRAVLADFDFNKDVIGSAYSIKSYTTNSDFGGDVALVIAKNELNKRGLKLILDYVPNHVAIDNNWAYEHPDYFINGTEDDLKNAQGEYIKVNNNIYALGRDPNFKPWSDVLQLNAFSPSLRHQSINTLKTIADKCDGVRCDMAMLVTNDIFKYTWQSKCGDVLPTEYWQDVTGAIRAKYSDFIFIAEAYWDTQEILMEQGFDYCYDKDFYDILKNKDSWSLKNHLLKPVSYQKKLLRFIENHDEPRAAYTFSIKHHIASAVILATVPGAHLFYNGQLSAKRVRTPVQLGRDPLEVGVLKIKQFYQQFFDTFKQINFNQNSWQLCKVTTARKIVKTTSKNVFAWGWQSGSEYYIAIINYSAYNSNANIILPWPDINFSKTTNTVIFLANNSKHPNIKIVAGSIKVKLLPYESLILELKS